MKNHSHNYHKYDKFIGIYENNILWIYINESYVWSYKWLIYL